jgi:hypothetical protein
VADGRRGKDAQAPRTVLCRGMPLSVKQRHKLLMTDRTRDAAWIAAVVENLLEAKPTVTLPGIDQVFRDGAAQTYLIAGAEFSIVLGMPATLAVAAAGMTIEQNRAFLENVDRCATRRHVMRRECSVHADANASCCSAVCNEPIVRKLAPQFMRQSQHSLIDREPWASSGLLQ